MQIAVDVPVQYIAQGMEHAVVEKHLPLRHVAQAGRQEHAAIRGLIAHIGPVGAADAQVVVFRILVGRDRLVARHAQRLVLVVGEQRRQAVPRRAVEVAGGAVPFLRVVEHQVAARLRRGEAGLAGEPGVELAGEGMEARILDLEARDGEHGLGHRLLRVLEYACAEQPPECIGILRAFQFPGHDCHRAGIHFGRVEQRTAGLLLQGIGPAVPEQAALGHEIAGRRHGRPGAFQYPDAVRGALGLLLQRGDLVVVALGVRADAERRLAVEVTQGRDGAAARRMPMRPAEHHRRRASRTVGARRAMATRAGDLPGARQALEEEQLPPELRDGRQGARRRKSESDRMRIDAGRDQCGIGGIRLRAGSAGLQRGGAAGPCVIAKQQCGTECQMAK